MKILLSKVRLLSKPTACKQKSDVKVINTQTESSPNEGDDRGKEQHVSDGWEWPHF